MKIVIFDIDGVIADNSHRLHFYPKQRELFYKPENVINDRLITGTKTLIIGFTLQKICVYLVTARRSNLLPTTVEWLKLKNVPYDGLFIRPEDDTRKPPIWKADIINTLQNSYDIIAFYDNEDENLRAVGEVIGMNKVIKYEQYKNIYNKRKEIF